MYFLRMIRSFQMGDKSAWNYFTVTREPYSRLLSAYRNKVELSRSPDYRKEKTASIMHHRFLPRGLDRAKVNKVIYFLRASGDTLLEVSGDTLLEVSGDTLL